MHFCVQVGSCAKQVEAIPHESARMKILEARIESTFLESTAQDFKKRGRIPAGAGPCRWKQFANIKVYEVRFDSATRPPLTRGLAFQVFGTGADLGTGPGLVWTWRYACELANVF